ncbi:Cell division control protein 2 [Verticillium dahliae VDG2]|nr:Cell division control protein 2 [Verticillium dahliae VDG2]
MPRPRQTAAGAEPKVKAAETDSAHPTKVLQQLVADLTSQLASVSEAPALRTLLQNASSTVEQLLKGSAVPASAQADHAAHPNTPTASAEHTFHIPLRSMGYHLPALLATFASNPAFRGVATMDKIPGSHCQRIQAQTPPDDYDLCFVHWTKSDKLPGAAHIQVPDSRCTAWEPPSLSSQVPRPRLDQAEAYLNDISRNPPKHPIEYYVGPSLEPGLGCWLHAGDELCDLGRVPGINEAYIHLGRAGSGTAFHCEDGAMRSVNFVISSGWKLWIVIASNHKAKFEAFIGKHWDLSTCAQGVRHVVPFIPPYILRKHKIDFELRVAGEGDLTVTASDEYHAVVNMHDCLALAINILWPGEKPIEPGTKICPECGLFPLGLDAFDYSTLKDEERNRGKRLKAKKRLKVHEADQQDNEEEEDEEQDDDDSNGDGDDSNDSDDSNIHLRIPERKRRQPREASTSPPSKRRQTASNTSHASQSKSPETTASGQNQAPDTSIAVTSHQTARVIRPQVALHSQASLHKASVETGAASADTLTTVASVTPSTPHAFREPTRAPSTDSILASVTQSPRSSVATAASPARSTDSAEGLETSSRHGQVFDQVLTQCTASTASATIRNTVAQLCASAGLKHLMMLVEAWREQSPRPRPQHYSRAPDSEHIRVQLQNIKSSASEKMLANSRLCVAEHDLERTFVGLRHGGYKVDAQVLKSFREEVGMDKAKLRKHRRRGRAYAKACGGLDFLLVLTNNVKKDITLNDDERSTLHALLRVLERDGHFPAASAAKMFIASLRQENLEDVEFVWENSKQPDTLPEQWSAQEFARRCATFTVTDANVWEPSRFAMATRPAGWPDSWAWPADPSAVQAGGKQCDYCDAMSCQCPAIAVDAIVPQIRIVKGERGLQVYGHSEGQVAFPETGFIGTVTGDLYPLGTFADDDDWTFVLRRPDLEEVPVCQVRMTDRSNRFRLVRKSENPSAQLTVKRRAGKYVVAVEAVVKIMDNSELTVSSTPWSRSV